MRFRRRRTLVKNFRLTQEQWERYQEIPNGIGFAWNFSEVCIEALELLYKHKLSQGAMMRVVRKPMSYGVDDSDTDPLSFENVLRNQGVEPAAAQIAEAQPATSPATTGPGKTKLPGSRRKTATTTAGPARKTATAGPARKTAIAKLSRPSVRQKPASKTKGVETSSKGGKK